MHVRDARQEPIECPPFSLLVVTGRSLAKMAAVEMHSRMPFAQLVTFVMQKQLFEWHEKPGLHGHTVALPRQASPHLLLIWEIFGPCSDILIHPCIDGPYTDLRLPTFSLLAGLLHLNNCTLGNQETEAGLLMATPLSNLAKSCLPAQKPILRQLLEIKHQACGKCLAWAWQCVRNGLWNLRSIT